MARLKKHYTHSYTVINNSIVKDDSISFRAKGIFIYLWSLPDNWTFSILETARHATEGKSAVRNAIHELETHGYLRREQTRYNNGKFSAGDWLLSEEPIPTNETNNAVVSKPGTRKPDDRKPDENVGKTTDYRTTGKRMSDNRTLQSTVVVDDVVGVDNARTRAKQNSVSDKDQENPSWCLQPSAEDFQGIQLERFKVFWKNAFGKEPNFVIQNQFQSWIKEYRPDLVLYAAELGLLADRPSDKLIGYMRTILCRWASNGIRTVTDAKQAGRNFKQQQTPKQNNNQSNNCSGKKDKHRYKSKYGRHHRHEQLPEWAQTGVAKQQKKASPEQLQQTQQLLAELRSKHQTLAQLRKGGANNHDGKTRNANQ